MSAGAESWSCARTWHGERFEIKRVGVVVGNVPMPNTEAGAVAYSYNWAAWYGFAKLGSPILHTLKGYKREAKRVRSWCGLSARKDQVRWLGWSTREKARCRRGKCAPGKRA